MSACPTPPAPLCATFFGEFGAEVIKVEQPRVGDDLRRLGRSADGPGGVSYGRAELERLRARGVI